MLDWFTRADPFTHTLAALLLFGRLGDIVSTRLATPTLRLEANPVARRLGWPFAWASVLISLVPYYSPAIGIAALVMSLLVSAGNLSRGWMYRALGETETEQLLLRVAATGQRAQALGFLTASAAFVVVAGLVLMWLSGTSGAASFWFGVGIVLYGVAIAVHGAAFIIRLFRRARPSDTAE